MPIYPNPRARINAENQIDAEDRSSSNSRPTKVPIATMSVSSDGATYGAVISFSLASSAKGFNSLRLLRSQGTDPTTATVLNTWSITDADGGKSFSYSNSDQSLATADTNYWVQGTPNYDTKLCNAAYISKLKGVYYGPMNLEQLNGNLMVPDPIVEFTASLLAGVNGTQQVCLAFKRPADPNFGSARVYIDGYHGNRADVAIAENSYSPFIFTVDQTGEQVTLKAAAISAHGISGSTSKSTSVTLNGLATVPCKLENVSAMIIAGQTQIDFDAGAETNITAYNIYRTLKGAGFSWGAWLTTITPSGSNHYTYIDPTGLNAFYDYYVVAINPVGASSPSNVQTTTPSPDSLDKLPDGTTYFRNANYGPITIDNANFEASATLLPPPGWSLFSGTLSYETSTPQSGKQSLKISNAGQWSGVYATKRYKVMAGDGYKMSAFVKGDGATSGMISINFFDGSDTRIGLMFGESGTVTSWSLVTCTGTSRLTLRMRLCNCSKRAQ